MKAPIFVGLAAILIALNTTATMPTEVSAALSTCPRITTTNISSLQAMLQLEFLDFHLTSIEKMHFSADDQQLLIVARSYGEAYLIRWNLSQNKPIFEIPILSSEWPVFILNANGTALAEGTPESRGILGTSVALYDTRTGKTLLTTNFSAEPLFFTSDGQSLVMAGTDLFQGALYTVKVSERGNGQAPATLMSD